MNINKLFNQLYLTKKALKHSLEEIFSLFFVKLYIIIQALINLAIWLMARYISVEVGQPQIALHYSVDFGIDLYGNTQKIYIIPLLGLIFIVVNFGLVAAVNRYNKREIRFIFHILSTTAIIANIMLLAAVVSIYIINFR